MKKAVLSWSGGKDSMLTLRELQRSGKYEVGTLLTTITEGYNRISMHGVRTLLLEKQAESLRIRLHKVYIPNDANNETYEKNMIDALAMYPALDVKEIAFGDVYLEDVKEYREKLIGRTRLASVYPIWKRDTKELISEFIDEGYKAVTVCIDTKKLPDSFLGRDLDNDFINDLPAGVDPCGENGEYHTFVYDGPGFREPVKFETGEKVQRGEFGFVDLVTIG